MPEFAPNPTQTDLNSYPRRLQRLHQSCVAVSGSDFARNSLLIPSSRELIPRVSRMNSLFCLPSSLSDLVGREQFVEDGRPLGGVESGN
jgi:hypothetical protein